VPAKISVKSNVKSFTRKLPPFLKKQVPFATSLALNETAKKAAKAQRAQAQRIFDRPTPFLLNGIYSPRGRGSFRGKRSTKRDLSALLVPGLKGRNRFDDASARINEVIRIQTQGGTRLPKKRALVVPTSSARLNKYGNLTRNRVQTLLNRSDVFSAGRAQGLPPGIYKRRRDGALRMLIAYEPSADYRKVYPYYRIANGVVRSQFDKEFRKAFKRAVSTAKIK